MARIILPPGLKSEIVESLGVVTHKPFTGSPKPISAGGPIYPLHLVVVQFWGLYSVHACGNEERLEDLKV